jgi:hypothetical protein
MFEMSSHCSFGHLKHKLWPKERLRIRLPVWLPTIKSQESTQYTCLHRVCNIPFESSWQKLQLSSDRTFIEGLLVKIWGSKVTGIPTWAILGLPRQKVIWMWAPWPAIEYTIKGKVVASPKSGSWWVLCVRVARGSS